MRVITLTGQLGDEISINADKIVTLVDVEISYPPELGTMIGTRIDVGRGRDESVIVRNSRSAVVMTMRDIT